MHYADAFQKTCPNALGFVQFLTLFPTEPKRTREKVSNVIENVVHSVAASMFLRTNSTSVGHDHHDHHSLGLVT